MRTFRIGLSVVSAIAISGAIHAATRVMPIHPEREKMSETRRRDLVLEDLKSILTGPSSPTTIATEPYASSKAGLCQRDVIQLKYERKRDDKSDGPVQPVGIGAISVQYHYLGTENGNGWANRKAWRKACEGLSGQMIYWAFGDDDHHASFALATLGSTVADVRKNQRFTIDCKELHAQKIKTSCVDAFLSAAEKISAISRRVSGKDQEYGFTSTPYQFTIVRTYSQVLDGGYSTAIKMWNEEIIVT